MRLADSPSAPSATLPSRHRGLRHAEGEILIPPSTPRWRRDSSDRLIFGRAARGMCASGALGLPGDSSRCLTAHMLNPSGALLDLFYAPAISSAEYRDAPTEEEDTSNPVDGIARQGAETHQRRHEPSSTGHPFATKYLRVRSTRTHYG